MKTCSKCTVEKTDEEFPLSGYVRKDGTSALSAWCESCWVEYRNTDGKAGRLRASKKWKDQNRDDVRAQSQEYRSTESHRKLRRERDRKNASVRSEGLKIRRRDDPGFRLACYLRTAVYHAVRGKIRAGSAVRDLGCSIPELKLHLESRFQPGMSWDNYGEWHVDHIKPLAKFDLTDRKQFLEVSHYTNLQPLWAGDNLSKGAR